MGMTQTATITCPHCGVEVLPENKQKHVEWHEQIALDLARLDAL
jgi:DNA-directed RNA polymerase subunit RPC12/RpoP